MFLFSYVSAHRSNDDSETFGRRSYFCPVPTSIQYATAPAVQHLMVLWYSVKKKKKSQLFASNTRHWRIMLEKVADSARKAVKLAEPNKPYGGQFLKFCSISVSTYQTCMKFTRKSTEFCHFFCRHYPQRPIQHGAQPQSSTWKSLPRAASDSGRKAWGRVHQINQRDAKSRNPICH